jgi:hypothetical protein
MNYKLSSLSSENFQFLIKGSAGCVSSTTPTANVNNTSSRTIITNKCVDISPSAELPAEDIPTMKETCPFDEIKNREPIEDKLELGKVESVDSASSESEKVVDEEFACRNGVSFKPGHCSYYYFEEEIDETRSAEESAEVNTHQQQRGEKNEEVQENEDKKIIKNGQSATGSSVVNDDVEIAIIQHKGYNKEGGGIVVAGSTGCKSNGILTKQQCDTLQANRYRLE